MEQYGAPMSPRLRGGEAIEADAPFELAQNLESSYLAHDGRPAETACGPADHALMVDQRVSSRVD